MATFVYVTASLLVAFTANLGYVFYDTYVATGLWKHLTAYQAFMVCTPFVTSVAVVLYAAYMLYYLYRHR